MKLINLLLKERDIRDINLENKGVDQVTIAFLRHV
jgi:hypothetical protein